MKGIIKGRGILILVIKLIKLKLSIILKNLSNRSKIRKKEKYSNIFIQHHNKKIKSFNRYTVLNI